MILDLTKCFPEGADGAHRPLPKQAELLRVALDVSITAPKFIRYLGGLGSGKSVVGCVAILSWAVLYDGDYVICREFGTDLRDTTYKTFMDLCPPELIAEHRIADKIVRIKNSKGTVSNIMFRGLDEPEKLKSLNLNGAYIDEANQTTEEAFTILQGRLRGKHVRKMILTTNSGGRNWTWRLFVDKSQFKSDWVKNQFYNITAPSHENIHLPDGYIQSMELSWSKERIQRELYGDEDSFEGAVYPEFKRDIHVVKPFRIPDNWERHIRVDHGYRNPASVGFYAVSPEGEVYKYREFYEREWLINEIINGKKIHAESRPGIATLAKGERFVSAKIDPSTKNRNGRDGTSDYDEYHRNWPNYWPALGFARNDVKVGIDRVKSYLKVNARTNKPLLYIFETCSNTIDEFQAYKYPELRAQQEGRVAEKEKPMKVNDHAMDETRYMIVDLPDPSKAEEIKEQAKAGTLERALQNELARIHNPPPRDPFGGT